MPIMALHCYYERIRLTCAYLYFRPHRFCGLCLFDWHHARDSQVSRSRLMCAPAVFTPPRKQATCRFVSALVPRVRLAPGFAWTLRLSTPPQRFTCVLLRTSHLTGGPAFSCVAHYLSLKVRQHTGGLAGAPVASCRTGRRGNLSSAPPSTTCLLGTQSRQRLGGGS